VYRFSLPSVLKYLAGILLAQAAAVVLALAALRTGLVEHWGLYALLALMIGLFAALWFAAIAKGMRHHAIARAQEDFSRERDKIRVQTERDKTKLIADTHRETIKTIRRVQAGASFRLGLGLACLLGLAGALLMMQLVTVGLLVLSAAGGALLGYVIRARQEVPGRADPTRRSLYGTREDRIAGQTLALDAPADHKRR
jgi:hypothetical protein